MRNKLLLFYFSILALACDGHNIPIFSDVILGHEYVQSGAQDIAGSILGGLSQELNLDLGLNSHRKKPQNPVKGPEETIILVVEEDHYEPDRPKPPPHHKHPPPPHHGHFPPPPPHHKHPPPPPPPHHKHPPPPYPNHHNSGEDYHEYGPHHGNPGRPNHFENQINWHHHEGGYDNEYNHQYDHNHHHVGHFIKPDYDNLEDYSGHKPGLGLHNNSPFNNPSFFNTPNINGNYVPNKDDHKHFNHNNLLQANKGTENNGLIDKPNFSGAPNNNNYGPNKHNQGDFYHHYPQRPNQEFHNNEPFNKPNSQSFPYQGNYNDEQSQPSNGISTDNHNQGNLDQNYSNGDTSNQNQNIPQQPNQGFNQNEPITSKYPNENYETSTIQTQNQLETTKDPRGDSPFFVPLPDGITEAQNSSTEPKPDTDNTKPVKDDDDDDNIVFPIDVRFGDT